MGVAQFQKGQCIMAIQIVIVILGLVVHRSYGTPLPPYNLQCERNLVGLSIQQLKTQRHHFATDNPRPLFSWTIAHTERGATQTGFEVLVSKDTDFNNIIWDSGVRKNIDHQQEIRYDGPPFEGERVYFWRVIWWDHNGIPAQSEEIGHFLAVTISQEDWSKAKWIAAPDGIDTTPTFVKKFPTMGKSVARAMLYISGLGYFRAWVNEIDLYQQADPPVYLAPGWTNYEIRVPYMVFDVSSYMLTHDDVPISIMLGTGWRNTSEFPPHDKSPVPDEIPRVLRLILTVLFTDSVEPVVVYSDKTWDVQTSKIESSSVYNGEVYNAMTTTTIVGKAVETPGPAGVMYLPEMPYIAETGLIDKPVSISVDPQSINDHYKQVVDFGNNTAGVLMVNVAELAKGQVLQIKHAEVPMHPPYGKRDGSLFFDNLRDADQLDYYTSNGTEKSYQPTFTYHGFRYALVTNYPRKLLPTDLYKKRINTNLKSNSQFHVSNDLLNNIQENVILGQLSNLMSVPTDCDQRNERLGWMGDAGLSADSMALNFQMASFFPHRTMLMIDEQINGSLPDVVPFYHGGGRPSDPSWGAAFPQTVWVLWEQYGDVDTARNHYSNLLDYIDFVDSQVPAEGISMIPGRYGDWVPPPQYKKIDTHFCSAFSFMQNIQQIATIAGALNDTSNAVRLQNMFSKYVIQFNKAYYSNYKYMDDLQVSYTLPLALNIVPTNDKEKVIANFLNRISADNTHVTAGIVGTKALLPVLTNVVKRHDIAMEIVTQISYPSWGFMIHNPDEPATAIWELWNSHNGSSTMDSRNHHMFSSVSGWMQTDMIGLKQQDGSYGYKVLDLYPAPSLDLSAASIQLEHPRPIKYSWHRKGGLQCGKAAEDQSPLNPNLPKHGGLKLSCGEGVIAQVQFASYGNSVGTCGYHRTSSCHVGHSIKTVEDLCLNKTECMIPTRGDYWGDDPCPGETKWLTAAVLCSENLDMVHSDLMYRYSSLKVDVSIPMGSQALLNLPSHGLSDLTVWDNDQMIYSNKILHKSAKGVESAKWVSSSDGDYLQMGLVSGEYYLTVKGTQPEEIQSVIGKGTDSHAHLRCSNERVITNIDWVSYGDPSIGNYDNFQLGTCHSLASRTVVEWACLGKNTCTISTKESFGNEPCHDMVPPSDGWSLVVRYSCNKR